MRLITKLPYLEEYERDEYSDEPSMLDQDPLGQLGIGRQLLNRPHLLIAQLLACKQTHIVKRCPYYSHLTVTVPTFEEVFLEELSHFVRQLGWATVAALATVDLSMVRDNLNNRISYCQNLSSLSLPIVYGS